MLENTDLFLLGVVNWFLPPINAEKIGNILPTKFWNSFSYIELAELL